MKTVKILAILLSITTIKPVLAVDTFVQELFLCNLGIQHIGIAASLGVDSISYIQNNTAQVIVASNTARTAEAKALSSYGVDYDKWKSSYQISTTPNTLWLKLGSDLYGADYFIEYCYSWKRSSPPSNDLHSIDIEIVPPRPIADTLYSLESSCAGITPDGVATSMTYTDSRFNVVVDPQFAEVRCSMRLRAFEPNSTVLRSHRLSANALQANINVWVDGL